MRPLSYRQRLFIEYYLGESAGSAVDAARRAGYCTPHPEGARLLRKATIRAAIEARVATAAMSANEVLARVADVASFDLLAFMNEEGQKGCKVDLKLVKRLGLGHVIKRLRINKDGSQDIELEPKLAALIKLGEHYKLWKGEAGRQITLVDVAKRLKERYEQIQRKERDHQPADDLSEPAGAVQ